ncbi:MAG: sulfite exporter TauE/SafE family protein [Firmicutes bacterium]|nr:sulfite exporter TauE/SafE family protein [Bacillota bacterium]
MKAAAKAADRRPGRKMKKSWACFGGFAAGVINGLLGAAGGLAVVPALRKAGASVRQSHATSVAVILPVSILSAVLYLHGGRFSFSDALPYLPGGVLGAAFGAWLLPKLPADLLRRIFGGFMLWAAIRLLKP